MNNVQEMMMDRRGATVVGLVIAACALQACAKTHGPHDSTETGNPPVIDAERVALVVQGDAVHVVGEKGAVDPGGVTIRVKNLVSNESASSRAANDGSFDVKAPGSANDGFSVEASNGDGDSKTVFVTQGGAAAAEGKDGTLSCDQQNQLAAEQLRAVVDAADDTCTQASDCMGVSIGSVCTDGCGGDFVSKAGLAEVEDAVSAVEHGLCADFSEQGCHYITLPCVGPQEPMCMNGHCRLHTGAAGAGDAGSDGDAAALSCADRENMAHLQLSRATADADRSCSGDGDCSVAPADTDCFGSCTFDVVSTKGERQVRDAITAINAGVCAGYRTGCGFSEPSCKPPPTPVCKQGQCFGMLDAAMCASSATLAQSRFDQASANIERTCTQQSDCSYAPLPTCVNPDCSVTVVSKTSAVQVQAIVDQINQDVCTPAEAGGCSYQPTGPVCSPPAAQCTNGKCQ